VSNVGTDTVDPAQYVSLFLFGYSQDETSRVSFRKTMEDRLKSPSTISFPLNVTDMGIDSSVGIATRYRLDGPGIESWWGARFFATLQTGPGAHPAPNKVGTESLSQE